MAKGKYEPTTMDRARDELFSHIMRCGVLDAEEEQRAEWMRDTVQYLAERFPELSRGELDELTQIGLRYCQPAIPHGPTNAADGAADGAGTAEDKTKADEVSVA